MEFKFTPEQIAELAKSQLNEQISKRVEEELESFDFRDFIEDVITDRILGYFNNKFMDSKSELNEFVVDSCRREILLWIVNNYYKDDMDELISEGLSRKFSQLGLEELMEFGKMIIDKSRVDKEGN